LTGDTTPKELQLKVRIPKGKVLQQVTVNGKMASIGGVHHDTLLIATDNKKQFEIVAQIG
jgi:hypothetical protein